jgi:hypothetical protein
MRQFPHFSQSCTHRYDPVSQSKLTLNNADVKDSHTPQIALLVCKAEVFGYPVAWSLVR